jgi:hypothetical protein
MEQAIPAALDIWDLFDFGVLPDPVVSDVE